MPTFPDWWNWDLSFTSHAELRMEQRGVTEVEVRAMLENATGFEPNVVEGRFAIHARRLQSPLVVIVEPEADAKLLVVVTVDEVSAPINDSAEIGTPESPETPKSRLHVRSTPAILAAPQRFSHDSA